MNELFNLVPTRERQVLPFPNVLLAQNVFLRLIISQDIDLFTETFKVRYLRRRFRCQTADSHAVFQEVLDSYKSNSPAFFLVVVERSTFEPIGLAFVEVLGVPLSTFTTHIVTQATSDDGTDGSGCAAARPTEEKSPPGDSLMSVSGHSEAELHRETACAEILLIINKHYRRKGYGKEAVEALGHYCIQHGCVPVFTGRPGGGIRRFLSNTFLQVSETDRVCEAYEGGDVYYVAWP
ncbi:hypothetical protein GMRT_12605 [Giardia muris]|uniref:N-acetyltransferase domain-containing protein n=1 Tax=Giardia muris TaxID=5742 RepID=A0A4Z1T3E1_GIAMU|nr:hypothetical protein GMRT_12605 [Giardia muris]|eukprot:TNJ28473.1 hypothetical protein GMRT_12605 [Giardia muris]